MNEQTDLEAVRKCLQGEVDAFETLIVRYQKPVMNLAYRIVRNFEDARDVAQAVFVKAFSGLSSFDPRYKFFSWLYRIAINESLNFAGKRNRRIDADPEWTAPVLDPEDQLVASELQGTIENAVLRLNPRQRALLALSVDGLSYKEIGRLLDLPERKVKSKLFSARNKLRGLLSQDGRPAHARS
jgi:RNA polymerase sigma-70 factor (ECF subfamily)